MALVLMSAHQSVSLCQLSCRLLEVSLQLYVVWSPASTQKNVQIHRMGQINCIISHSLHCSHSQSLLSIYCMALKYTGSLYWSRCALCNSVFVSFPKVNNFHFVISDCTSAWVPVQDCNNFLCALAHGTGYAVINYRISIQQCTITCLLYTSPSPRD